MPAQTLTEPRAPRLLWLLLGGAVLASLIAHPLMAESTPEAAPEAPSCVGCHSGGGEPEAFSRINP